MVASNPPADPPTPTIGQVKSLLADFDLDFAFAQAAAWNADFGFQPPRWALLLHPAVALERRAAFLSFNPTLRKCAKKAGLNLLPEQL